MSIELIVDRSVSEYSTSSKCLVYIDPDIMDKYQLHPNDIIEITTPREKSTVARIASPILQDRGKSIIRLDRFLRQAIKASINETVGINKIEIGDAKRICLSPAIDVSIAHDLVEHLTKTFSQNMTPVSVGSILYCTFHDSVAGTTYKVVEIEGEKGVITENTEIIIESPELRKVEFTFDTTFEDVGGLGKEIKLIRELVQLSLQFPQIYRQIGINQPRGIILYGPPGCGKTHLTRAISNELKARFYYINGPSIIGTYAGETEANLRKIFFEAAHHGPSVIFIDELDAIAPKRGDVGSQSDIRAITQLLALLDGIQRVDGVIVIGTTNRVDAIDLAFRRPGRFDREIYVGPPDSAGRYEILKVHTREMPLSGDTIDYLIELAKITHGFVGADIMELCREAGLNALRRSNYMYSDSLSAFQIKPENIEVLKEDFLNALGSIKPSAIREVLISASDVTWDDIGGLSSIKKRLKTFVEFAFKGIGINKNIGVPGILLYGPPGTGKTMLAKALANEGKVNFIALDGPEIFSKWLGESEEAVRHVFRVAKQLSPAIVFFDQIDAIAPSRGMDSGSRTTERVVNQLLSELDGIEATSNILTIGATNRMDLVDPALLRYGRLGTHIYIPIPDKYERREILNIFLANAEFDDVKAKGEIIDLLAERADGFSGAQLRAICEEAKWMALSEDGYDKESIRLKSVYIMDALEQLRNEQLKAQEI
ncbi:MAG: AAA family ATPase [Syntrophales bacterium]|nr:AAA family ATPase [Syntrophales bacterium]